MSCTDELASSLSCTELFSDSPSTSTSRMADRSEHRRRSHRIVLQPVTNNNKRLSLQQVASRKRTSIDVRLNSAQQVSVRTLPDRNLAFDVRILDNLIKAEQWSMPINSHYFTSVQEHVLPVHREQAIDWIYDVSKEERCDVDVFPLAVSLMDRFLSNQNIFREDIQVLAGVCLFIANKLKAPQPINAQRMAYYTADSVRVQDFLAWELLVLSELEWDLSQPTAFDFFDQMVHRLPLLAFSKEAFTHVVHNIQRVSKIGMLIPSLQCALALMYVTRTAPLVQQQLQRLLPATLNVNTEMLVALIPLVDRVLHPSGTLSASNALSACASTVSPQAPPSSCRTPSPTTTGGPDDSGFCSGVNSPESAGKKEQMDCSPPKMPRIQY